MTIAQPHGLKVEVWLPIISITEAQIYLINRKLGVASDIELTRLAIRLNVINHLDLSASVTPGIDVDRFFS